MESIKLGALFILFKCEFLKGEEDPFIRGKNHPFTTLNKNMLVIIKALH